MTRIRRCPRFPGESVNSAESKGGPGLPFAHGQRGPDRVLLDP